MTRLFYFVLTFALVAIAGAKEIGIGLIGLDTSHVTAFTKIINDPKAEGPRESAPVQRRRLLHRIVRDRLSFLNRVGGNIVWFESTFECFDCVDSPL